MAMGRLKVDPQLGVGPVLTDGSTAQVVGNIRTGEQMTITGLKSDHATHKEMGPHNIDFVADVGRGVIGAGKNIDSLAGAIPIIFCIRQVQV